MKQYWIPCECGGVFKQLIQCSSDSQYPDRIMYRCPLGAANCKSLWADTPQYKKYHRKLIEVPAVAGDFTANPSLPISPEELGISGNSISLDGMSSSSTKFPNKNTNLKTIQKREKGSRKRDMPMICRSSHTKVQNGNPMCSERVRCSNSRCRD